MNLNRPRRSARYSLIKLSKTVRCECAVRISQNSNKITIYTPNVMVTVRSVIVFLSSNLPVACVFVFVLTVIRTEKKLVVANLRLSPFLLLYLFYLK